MNQTERCIICGRVFPTKEAEYYKKKPMCLNCWDNYIEECNAKDKSNTNNLLER